MNVASLTSAPLARLRGVRHHYGKTLALDGLDLALSAGQVLALLGPNGAGKTTAISLLLGLQRADAGTVELFGLPPQSLHARRRAGVMLQSAAVPDTLKVRELIDLTRAYYPQPRSVADLVALAGLDGLMERRYGRLSGGQQRRVQFALAVCGRPDLLFLDEPTTGLDIDARQMLWRAIRELSAQGCAVLLTTHYLEEAEALADRVVVVNHGRAVAEGTVAQIRARVAQRRIRCNSQLPVALVQDWPGVQLAQHDGERLEIVVEAAEPIVRRLLAEDASLSDLEVQRAGLADAFLALTRDAAQKEAA
ncbi:ABC-2 type transport system ATP-binding protein [Pseudoxanthomonas japonensis]|uniref:ABC transporter ATP-binding protein n=1 Tax=Pseudoxanthomonas japonensis TaxID=69284 RepID=UPI002857A761|nr:ABC transporter ATP-binding protein [Pseudoxanthomonas japonensis]MDR7069824.1 ABC-2 type transport system ATP-binding protein [Pseudoxanthomonas japonensis]